MRSRLGYALVCLAVLAVLLAGCLDQDRAGFTVVNKLSAPVDVVYVRGTDRIPIIANLTPGHSYEINQFVVPGECVRDTMVATDQSGTVVATFPGPVCNHTTWEIGTVAASPSA
jgi:hypothetical protein